MADVRPFRGVRYNPARVADLAPVTCPPYDVISSHDQRRYYERHPLNVVRLEQGLEQDEDTPEDNKYSRAAAQLRAWLDEGILVTESAPAFYVYDQQFVCQGRSYRRRSLLAAVRLEEWERRVVLPHERTMSRPKADRLSLLRACRANFSPLMALYEDPAGEVERLLAAATRGAPSAELVDEVGDGHQLWVVDDEALTSSLAQSLAPGPLYIADGHHRYETALHYRNERRALEPSYRGDEPYNFVLMALTSLSDPGLVVLPTHRLVAGPPRLSQQELLARLSTHFTCERLALSGSDPAAEVQHLLDRPRMAAAAPVFGLYSSEEDAFYRLTLRNAAAVHSQMPADRSAAWKGLDVSILHTAVVDGVLRAAGVEDGLTYTRDDAHALRSVRTGENWLALFLRSTPVGQIREIALAGDRMPQKSTYFYPKLITGLVMHRLD